MRTHLMVPLISLLFISVAFPADTAPPAPPIPLTWSHPDTDKTPVGNIQFHGPFTNDIVRISADNLPAHPFLEISFDLLILRTWDGSSPMSERAHPQDPGPDFFRVALTDGPTLLYTTFSNRPDDDSFRADSKWQMYPSQVPGTHLDPQTGADAKNTLGYAYPWPGPSTFYPMDATYHIKFIIPHNSAKATLELGGMNLSSPIDESWGITNLQFRPITDPGDKPDSAAIATAFAHALDAKATDQPASFQTLILGMDDTAEWIVANVQPQTIDAAMVADDIGKLSADDHNVQVREGAFDELRAMGPQIEPYLRDARRSAPADLRVRIDWLLESIGTTEIADENIRRVMLATRVLEIIGTPHALEVRKALTQSN